MQSRWPNIFIQEGVWSKPVIHIDSVSTPEYFWCIASHFYAFCLPIQAYTCEPTFNAVKMAEYLHPGRGVVKPRDPHVGLASTRSSYSDLVACLTKG